MELKRPIVVLDIEGTGLSPDDDRIIELGLIKISIQGERTQKCRRFNPTIPIKPGATEVHGIKDEDVKNEPTFAKLGRTLYENLIKGCDIVTFGGTRYDIPLLYNEFARIGIIWDYRMMNFVDVDVIFKRKEPRDLAAAVKYYLQKEHTGAHGAMPDTLATHDVLMKMLQRYDDLHDMDMDQLAMFTNYDTLMLDLNRKFTYDSNNEVVFNFGKDRGKRAKDNPGLLQWMLDKDFAPDTKEICHLLLADKM